MPVKLSDGTIIDTTDINRLLAIFSEREKGNDLVPNTKSKAQPKAVQVAEIQSKDGVKIKLGNVSVKKKQQPGFEHENYIEVKRNNSYGSYIIRVWRYENVFGCNCIKGNEFRYMEFSFTEHVDENSVFKCVQKWLDAGGF